MGLFTLAWELIWSTFLMTTSFTTQKRLDWSPNVYNSSANCATHTTGEWTSSVGSNSKFASVVQIQSLQIELLHLTNFHSTSNWRQNPYYKSLKFKVYDLHSSSNSNLCLAPCVPGWVNLLASGFPGWDILCFWKLCLVASDLHFWWWRFCWALTGRASDDLLTVIYGFSNL